MKHRNIKVGALYQAAAFGISILLLTVVFYSRFTVFTAHDPPNMLQKRTVPHQVQAGLHITSFSTFDVLKNRFVLEGTVWFAYDPSEVKLEQIKQFDVVHGELMHKSEPAILEYQGEELAQFNVRIQFDTFLNYRLFPIDDHIVRLSLTNHFLPQDVQFRCQTTDITLEENLFLPGWKINGVTADTGYSRVDLVKGEKQLGVEYPQAVISIACERTDPSIVVNILLTLILILFMSLLTFSTDEDSVLVVSVIIVALIGYRAVMLSIGPAHISYFMLSDYMYLISLSASVLTLLAGIFCRDERVDMYTKKLFIAGIYLFFVGGCSLMSFIL